jgi:hypothetical protein
MMLTLRYYSKIFQTVIGMIAIDVVYVLSSV